MCRNMCEIEKININGEEEPQIVIPIIGDGACLFNMLSFISYNTQERCQEVCKKIVFYVAENWDQFDWTTYDSYGHCEMSQHLTYGGTYELLAAGKIYPYLFEVYYQKNFYAKFGQDSLPIKRLRFTGNINHGHFEVYLPISEIGVLKNFTDITYNSHVNEITFSQNFILSSQSISKMSDLNKVKPSKVRPPKRISILQKKNNRIRKKIMEHSTCKLKIKDAVLDQILIP